MLTERAEHLDTEQEVSGQPSIWEKYTLSETQDALCKKRTISYI